MHVDYIIVGQGIAGTVLAHILIQKGKKIIVFDEDTAQTASKVAAGLFNPIVFKRLVKSWKADEFIAFNRFFYKELEQILQQKFYQEQPVYKIISSSDELHFWNSKIKNITTKPYLDEIKSNNNPAVKAPYQFGVIQEAGSVDVKLLLESSKNYLIGKGCYKTHSIDYSKIKFDADSVWYHSVQASKIIFCEGYKAVSNPFFKALPFKLTKGEVIRIKAPELKLKEIVSKNIYVLPKGNDEYTIGATYEWNFKDDEPTQTAKSVLIEKLRTILSSKFEVISHQAGIRPTVKDRRPLIGLSPLNNKVSIFNGLGTRGVLLAPWLANNFADFLAGKNELDKEADINRFFNAKEKPDPNLSVIHTKDGSYTIYHQLLDETYHSIHGAVQEAKHVFIDAGLKYFDQKNLSVFEIGFGTGLNACLTFVEAQQQQLNIIYHTIEKYPLSKALIGQLNYSEYLSKKLLLKVHDMDWETENELAENFTFKKISANLLDYELKQTYDICYFDAFAPNKQPELWSEIIFKKLFDSLKEGGILVTYCAKGAVKRTLKQVGFEVQTLPGPPGKREMVRAVKARTQKSED